MSRKLHRVIAALVVVSCATSIVYADPIALTIDSTKSSFTLNFPDQTVKFGPTNVTLRVRNQDGQGTAWNQGNTAALAGTVQADFNVDQHNPSNYLINFTGSGLGIAGVNSGFYRPSISQYTGGTVNPDGTASGGNYSGLEVAPAVFGALVNASVSTITARAAYLSFYNTFFDVQGSTSIATSTGSFSTAGLTVGISQSLLAADGQSLPLVGTLFPDQVTSVTAESTNLGGTGTVGGSGLTGMFTLSLPISQNISIDLGNNAFLTGTASGMLVMSAFVPEPNTLLLAGAGLMSLAIVARRKLARR